MCCGCWILAGVLALFLIGVAVLCLGDLEAWRGPRHDELRITKETRGVITALKKDEGDNGFDCR